MLGRHVFESVRLVEDSNLVIRQQAGSHVPKRQITHKQGMVDDQEMSLAPLPAGFKVETVGVAGTLASQTIAAVALHQIPNRRQRLEIEVASTAVLRSP